MDIPTVKVKNPDAKSGFTTINESDFDPSRHELFDAPAKEDITREAVDAMGKDGLRDILDGHGVEYDGRASLKALRSMVKRTVFVDL